MFAQPPRKAWLVKDRGLTSSDSWEKRHQRTAPTHTDAPPRRLPAPRRRDGLGSWGKQAQSSWGKQAGSWGKQAGSWGKQAATATSSWGRGLSRSRLPNASPSFSAPPAPNIIEGSPPLDVSGL